MGATAFVMGRRLRNTEQRLRAAHAAAVQRAVVSDLRAKQAAEAKPQ